MVKRLPVLFLAVLIPACGTSSSGGGGGGGGGSWSTADIGSVGSAGSTSLSGDQATVSASGTDIWDTADAFRFVWKAISGDGEITAKVLSLGATDAWAKAGVMIRESLDPGSRFAMTVTTPSNGTSLQHRTETNQGCGLLDGPDWPAPVWVRLSRSGATFTGSVSTDGASWTAIGSQTISMAANVLVGLCVTSHNNGATTTATFDGISQSGGGGGVPGGPIAITHPLPRIVYQRAQSGSAVVPVRGSCPAGADQIQARAVAVNGGTTTGWATIAPSGGSFQGTLSVSGGWYSLEVKALASGAVVSTAGLDRFGVGEVFVVVGHSVAQGGDIHIEGSTDERGITIPDQRTDQQKQDYNNTASPAHLPPLAFAQYGNGVVAAPYGGGTYFWAKFAQYVAQSRGVPVVVLNAAFGGTSLEHWAWSSQGIQFAHGFVNSSIRMPYINLYNSLKHYVNHTGIRAVLADQGQNDWPQTDANAIFGNYLTFVNQARADLGHASLAIVVNRHTPFGDKHAVRTAQQKMINEVAHCYTGPDYDTLGAGDTYDGIHLSAQGCWAAAQKWADAISPTFLANSQPWLPGY